MRKNSNKTHRVHVDANSQAPTRLYRFDPASSSMVEQPKTELFIKGPIFIAWLNVAARLPGKAINVALAIHWLSGMSKSKTVKLTRKALQQFNVSNDAATDALNRMESAGLLRLTKRPGQRTSIEILSV